MAIHTHKLFLALCLAVLAWQPSLSAQNANLVGQLPYSQSLNDIWGWADAGGHEYALVGVRNGLSIVDVSTDPTSPTELFFVEGPASVWRDMKTFGDYAYCVHDNVDAGAPGAPGIGLLIVNMASLPASIDTVTIKDFGAGVRFDHAHNIFIDEMGFLYVFGANYGVGGAIMLDLNADPWNPTLAGVYNAQYVHDGFVRDNKLWTAEIYTGNFALVDVSVKASPIILATQQTPTNFTHNIWLSDDDAVLYTTDEVNSGYLGAFDVSDPSDITELDRWNSNPGSGVIPHNSFVYGNYLLTSYYRDGVTVHDISRPSNMVLVGQYDTSPLEGFGYDGCWGVYPYTPSGLVYATDVLTGFFVLDVTYTQAAWLEGAVSVSGSGSPLNGATLVVEGTPGVGVSDIFGNYGTGVSESGTYTVTASAPGYTPRTYLGVVLTQGLVATLNVELDPLPSTTFSGQITDAVTGAPVAGAQIQLINDDYSFEGTADASGNYSISNVYLGTYEAIAGKWGYVSAAEAMLDLAATSTWNVELEVGIYDDFTFDFGWSAIGATWIGGQWERGPSVVYDPGYGFPITPDVDDPEDPGQSCYVTGNASDVDFVHAGESLLRSPEFDPRSLDRPTIRFRAVVFNTDFNGLLSNDELLVRLSDASSTVTLDQISAPSAISPLWVEYEYEISEFKDPGPGMRLLLTAKADGVPFVVEDLLEVAIDAFRVEPFVRTTGLEYSPVHSGATVYPNPVVGDQAVLQLEGMAPGAAIQGEMTLSVFSVTGKKLRDKTVTAEQGQIAFSTEGFAQGLYLFELKQQGQRLASGKFSVVR
ncbi:MAG: choice-of-anchor B family protein [Bacteroidetes bacterium]|nr:choice-of-anchor B family protein [Bacteroidota bacterium]